MRSVGLATLLIASTNLPAAASDARFENALRQLDPVARLEQVCDLAAMARIDRDPNKFHPDRAMAGALAEPKMGETSIEAKGAAFRSGGKWYQLSYSCRTSPDQMKVLSFDYRIGAAIPEEKWDSYGLPR